MTVSTQLCIDGTTKVSLRGGCTDKINIYFKSREDALALLKALRKRVR